MVTGVEIISPKLWGDLLGEYGRNPDPETQKTNQAMRNALEAGFGVFAEFRERLEPQGFRAIRKYLASGADQDHPTHDTVLLIAVNLLHPNTDYNSRNPRDRYDMPGEMIANEHTFHQNVAGQLRMRAWRRDQSLQGGPPWHADVRLRYWGNISPHLQPFGIIPSLFVTSEVDRRGFKYTNLSFPVNREDPSQTTEHIKLALKVARPLILAGFQGSRPSPF